MIYGDTGSDSHVRSRRRIMLNQAKFWASEHPELASLDLTITEDSAELVCTVFQEHLKTSHPMARMVPLTSMYEHILTSGQGDQLGDGARRILAEMYIARGMAGKALPHLPEGDPMIARIEGLLSEHRAHASWAGSTTQITDGKRGNSLGLYLDAHPDLITCKTVLHVAPEPQLTTYFEQAQQSKDCIYRPVEGMRPGKLEHHDLCELEIEDASIDTILCHHVLEHIVDDRKAISEMHRVLKPGGILNCSVPQVLYLEQTADWAIPDNSFHGHVRTYGRDLKDRLSAPGFDVSLDDWLFQQPFEVMDAAKALYMVFHNAVKV